MKVQSRFICSTLGMVMIVILSTSYLFLQLQEKNSQVITNELNKHNSESFNKQLKKRGSQLLSYLSHALYNPLYKLNLHALASASA